MAETATINLEVTESSTQKTGVELVGNNGFKIQLERLRRSDLIDQGDEMLRAKGQGCISNPNGPTC
jgi:hypothetical protein